MNYLKLTAAIAAGVFLGSVVFDLYQHADLQVGWVAALWIALLVGVPAWALTIGGRNADAEEKSAVSGSEAKRS